MHLLVLYGTTDGHTRRIARHVTGTLATLGHGVEMLDAGDAEGTDPASFSGALLTGSVHLGGFQKALANFAHAHRMALNAMPTLFLPVSLSAAGREAGDWTGLERIVADFVAATGWTPARIEHVAGAYLPSVYDVVRAWGMRRMLAERDPGADPGVDRVYTDWPKLAEIVTDWAAAPGR
jgi:menaquinone-dependent protoporphyrinogen oxidase